MKENILIVYYSYSGKTRRIANRYTYRSLSFPPPPLLLLREIYNRYTYRKQVREENRSEKLPALLPITESAGGYDIVFAGSPKMEHGYICV